MIEIALQENGNVSLIGRLDAAQSAVAQDYLDQAGVAFSLDLSGLEYISSAGLGVLLKTHKRLVGAGQGLKLVNVSHHIKDVFKYSGFDKLFTIV
jgi:anti-sigma B factor antagonist